MKRKPETAPSQKTRPYGTDAEGKPAKPETIPVPTRGEFFHDLEKIAPKPGKSKAEEPNDAQ